MILIICRFHIREFPYLLKFICNSQIHTCGPLRSFTDLCRTLKNLNGTHSQPRWKQVLPALFQLLWWEDHRVQAVGQGRTQGCRAGASWRGLESVLWHLLVTQPWASHLSLLNLWFSLSVSVSLCLCVCLSIYFFYCDEIDITHFNHFKVYNSLVLSTFTVFCNHDCHPFPDLFHHPKQKLCIH